MFHKNQKHSVNFIRKILIENPQIEKNLKTQLEKEDEELTKTLQKIERKKKLIESIISENYEFAFVGNNSRNTEKKQRLVPEELPQIDVMTLMHYQPQKDNLRTIPKILVTDCDEPMIIKRSNNRNKKLESIDSDYPDSIYSEDLDGELNSLPSLSPSPEPLH